MSYGPDSIDPYGRAAGYVDEFLRGARNRLTYRSQQPTKYELIINLKTAKALRPRRAGRVARPRRRGDRVMT